MAEEIGRDAIAGSPVRNKRQAHGEAATPYTLQHPDGFNVTVTGATRKNELVSRGYTVVDGEEDPGEVKGDFDPSELTVKEVLEWVGDDVDRASLALDAENAREDDARQGLVNALQKIAANEL